jgi:hypothetical protein
MLKMKAVYSSEMFFTTCQTRQKISIFTFTGMSNIVTEHRVVCLNIRSSGNKIESKSTNVTYEHGTSIPTVTMIAKKCQTLTYPDVKLATRPNSEVE